MPEPVEATDFYRILVAIETDATRYYGPRATRPALLSAGDAEQLLAHVAADLTALLPAISDCSLITAGALFDQTQILRLRYPVFTALESVAGTRGAGPFRASLVSIGAKDAVMPVAELQPLEDIPLGLLQLLPVVVHGPSDLVSELGQAMEYRFLEEGQISAHSAAWMEAAFGIRISHARLMTLTDLNAMLRLQLEHFGFMPLWELLDAALSGRGGRLEVSTESGRVFEWRDGAVHTQYETFDYWASAGGGSKLSAARQTLAEGYGEWTRETRQYLTTLEAHGITVHFHRPGDSRPLEGTFFIEPGRGAPGKADFDVTEHSYGELGTVVITAVRGDRIEHYYPLCPQGLNDVHDDLRKRDGAGRTVAFPGGILYDEKTRALRPDRGDAKALR